MDYLVDSLSPDSSGLDVATRMGSLVGLGGHFFFIFLFLWLNVLPLAWVSTGSCLVYLLCYALNQRGRTHLALLLGSAEVMVHAALAVIIIGWDAGFHLYFFGLIPLIYYSQKWSSLIKSLLAVVIFLIYSSLFSYSRQAAPWYELNQLQVTLVSWMNIAILFFVLSVLTHFYRSSATQAERALKQANQKLEYLAHTDMLTRLINRRNILDAIEHEVVQYHQTQRPFSILMGDVDNFKTFNDSYGHEIGDQVLVRVADILKSGVRQEDLVSRWGGEEFLVLLPGADLTCARAIAERLRANLAASCIAFAGHGHQITMTFGVATYTGCREAAECIRRADEAMYDGKRRGKNCVVASEKKNQ